MAAPIRIGEEVELRIDSLAYGGNGVGRLDGFVVFVRGGLPGDVVRARATKVKRGFAEATRTALLEPGPDRVPAPCRHFGVCGNMSTGVQRSSAYPKSSRSTARSEASVVGLQET